MLESFSVYPLSFWVMLLLLIGGGCWAINRVREGIGLPVLAVLGTTAVWYIGDAVYNDYAVIWISDRRKMRAKNSIPILA